MGRGMSLRIGRWFAMGMMQSESPASREFRIGRQQGFVELTEIVAFLWPRNPGVCAGMYELHRLEYRRKLGRVLKAVNGFLLS
jgi:hypothetical protein